jgi:MFS family permease
MAKPPLMSLPIIFQLSRMFFAFLSDFLGRKLFFVLKGFLSMISSLLYYLACTPLDFLAGKITEGVGDASLWAVNRAFILEKIKIQKVLVYLRTIDYVSVAIGCLLAGFLIKLVSYRNTLMFCFLVSTVVCVASLFLIKKKE